MQEFAREIEWLVDAPEFVYSATQRLRIMVFVNLRSIMRIPCGDLQSNHYFIEDYISFTFRTFPNVWFPANRGLSGGEKIYEREERDLCRPPARILSSMRMRLIATNDILVTSNVTSANRFSREMIPAVNKSGHAQ